jgi:hypothetical protein
MATGIHGELITVHMGFIGGWKQRRAALLLCVLQLVKFQSHGIPTLCPGGNDVPERCSLFFGT